MQAGDVILNATGYIIAAHKIEVAAKVVGKVAWLGALETIGSPAAPPMSIPFRLADSE